MKHLGTLALETERLILRPFRMEDAQDMFQNWAGNDTVTRFLTWPTHPSAEVSGALITAWVKEYENKNNYQWCIENKAQGQAIGSIGVVNLEEDIEAMEMGYCIGEGFWNQGFTTEALKRVIAFLFYEVSVNRVWARHDSRNPNSGKVMQKAGMTYEGTHREASVNNSGICDIVVYGITKDMFTLIK
ncbi:MAG: GNAT family N-acetyltransferase [Eubacteriales bacterium]